MIFSLIGCKKNDRQCNGIGINGFFFSKRNTIHMPIKNAIVDMKEQNKESLESYTVVVVMGGFFFF